MSKTFRNYSILAIEGDGLKGMPEHVRWCDRRSEGGMAHGKRRSCGLNRAADLYRFDNHEAAVTGGEISSAAILIWNIRYVDVTLARMQIQISEQVPPRRKG